MAVLLILFGLVLCYFLLFWLVPKGNLLNELLDLSQYWLKIFFLPKKELTVSRFYYGKHRRQYLLLYQGPKPSTKEHFIVYFHGGAWGFGSPESFRSNAQVLVDQGYDVFMPSYRRIPRFHYQHIREAITSAMARIRKLSEDRGMKQKKIILGGMSAGGHLAALILYDRKELALTGYTPADFAGLFLLGAPLQLRAMHKTPILWFLAGSRKSQRFQEANPVNYLEVGSATPILIIHGKKDGIVAFLAAAQFYTKMEKLNPGVTKFHVLERGGHLDVAKWVYLKEGPQKWLLEWLDELEKARRRF